MSENRGIFSLEEFYDLQVSGETTNIFQVFRYVNVAISSAPAFGYLAGGKSSSGDRSSVDRIDYGNDTATAAPKGTLVSSQDGGNIAGTGNQSFGYTCGTSITNVNRIDYSSDTSTSVRKGTLSSARAYISAVGNRNFGYWCGGNLSRSSFIDRIDYSNDTAASTPKGPLSRSILASAATGNFDFGYVGGLYPGMSLTERIDYSNDTAGTLDKGALIASGYMVSAAGNSNFGYWNGGSHGSRVGRLDYANDSVNAVFRGNTTFAGVKRGGTGSGNFGYFTGGDPSSVTIVDRVDYSNDTSIAAKGNLSLGKFYHAGVSAQENGLSTIPIPATRTETNSVPVGTNFGYMAGGGFPSKQSTVDRVDFTSDTSTMSPKGALVEAITKQGESSNTSYGYFTGGEPGRSTVVRIDYSNDTATAATKGPLSSSADQGAGTGNDDYGYHSGRGATGIDRIDYSNDTATASTKGNLTRNSGNRAAAGSQSYGYFSNGSPSHSNINRIDFSNDTALALEKGNLSAPGYSSTYGLAASGNGSYGYWAGGRNGSSIRSYVQRLDYSNDSANTVTKGPLAYYQSGFGATGNDSYGYFGGAHNGGDSSSASPGQTSYISRVDYANDSATASPKGPLSSGRGYVSGVSSRRNGLPSMGPKTVDKGADGYQTGGSLGPAFGYFASARPAGPTYYTMIDRVDYSNDTPNMVQKGSMITTKYDYGSVASQSHGYMGAGFRVDGTNPNAALSSVERSDFSNDTATTVAKGPLTRAATGMRGAGNTSYGWMMGEYIVKSTVDRIDYSNDTATALVRGNLGMNQANHGAAGNMNYGYNAGGFGGPSTTSMSNVNRFDYSNDTANGVEKGPLTYATYDNAGVGNADFGYFMGGGNPSPYAFYSKVDRVDYSNDTVTASTKGSLGGPSTRGYMGTAGNPAAGYVGGGTPGPTTSRVDKIDYSNDTATATAKGSLTAARYAIGGFSGQDNGMVSPLVYIPRIRWVDSDVETSAVTEGPAFGYFAGGYTGSSRLSTMDRIDYSNDTPTATPKGPITVARNTGSATSNLSHGYFSGGYDGSDNLSRVDRVDYSNDTATATAKGNLEDGRTGAGGVGNINFGYVAGGRLESTNSESSQIDRIEYSNDTATALEKGNLLNNKYYYQGAVGNQDFGYFGGGRYPAPGGHSRVERIEYANDTATTVAKGPLSFVKNKIAATGTPAYGYFAGGSPTPYNTTVDRIDYANDTATASPKSTLTQGRGSLSAVSSPSHGYFGGGYAGSRVSTVDKIDFSNDTATATTVGTLSVGKSSVFATSSRNDALPSTVRAAIAAPVQPPFPFPVQLHNPATNKLHGYIGGGSFGPLSSVDRITFANDTATATPKGSLTATKYRRSGTGNLNYGYIGAGRPGPISVVDRIDYTNDTATATAKGPLSQARAGAAAVGNANYGYWFGGNQPGRTTRVDRLDFASDSSTAVTKGSLTAVRAYGSAVGNQNYGYHCGGDDGNPKSNIDRVDYSNDTPTMSPKGQLSFSQSAMMADFSNANYGWLAGRSPGPSRSIVDRVDFSNDTGTTPARGPLTENRARATGTGDSNYGYACGGMPEFSSVSKVERVDYSNDTATASPKGNLTGNRADAGGVSAADNGL